MSGRYNNGNNNGNDDGNKFCAVCSSAGRPDFNTHFVRADKFNRNSAITCPYLLSIQCRICGGNGHTASYCKFQSQSRPQPQRLPPISSSQQQHRAPPRIVFETSSTTSSTTNPQKTERINFERAFPPLNSSSTRLTLPPLPLSHVSSRVRNDEPLLRRGPPEASPVHSPAPKKKRSNNPFAALASSSSDSEGSDYYSPVAVASSPDGVGRCRRQKSGASWKSVVTASPVHEAAAAVKFPPRVAPRLAPLAPRVAPLAPLAPPLVFKSNAKPNWGDTDSEDDEEFLKKGGQ